MFGEGVNLFDLAARVSADTRDADKNLTATQKKVLQLAEDFKKVDKSAQTSSSNTANALRRTETAAKTAFTNVGRTAVKSSDDVSQALATLSPRLGMVAGSAGPLTAVAAGLVAVGAAAAGIYKLATFAAQLGGEIFDMSQKINFSAETLSGLKVAAELSGGSLEDLSTSLGIFDRNLEEAHQKGSEMSRVFKVLKIDINDNEKALRQAFQAIAAMPAGYQQTAVAMKLFGRSGKEILGIIKETDGEVDKFIARMRDLGLVITSEGAKKADEFGDRLTMLQNKLEAIAREIGTKLIPLVERATTNIDNWLTKNQQEISKTADELGSLAKIIGELYALVQTPIYIQFVITRKIVEVAAQAVKQVPGGPNPEDIQLRPGETRESIDPYTGRKTIIRGGGMIPWEQGEFALPGGEQAPREVKVPPLDFSKPGGGGKKAQRDILEGLKTSLIGLNAEFRKFNTELLGSANLTAEAAMKEKLLADVMSSLSVKTRLAISEMSDVDEAIHQAIGSLPKKSQEAARALVEQSKAQVQLNEAARISGELDKEAKDLTKQWAQEIENIVSGADEYTVAIQGLEKAYAKYGKTLDEGTRSELEHQASVLRTLAILGTATSQIDAMIRMYENMNQVIELARPGEAFRELQTSLELLGEPPEVSETFKKLIEARERFRNDIQNLAYDLTSVLDRAIYDGFSQGAKRGLASLAIGLLDMIKNVFLKQLEIGLAQVLTNALGGPQGTGGGGNFFSKLFSFGLSALGGLFGGGGSLPVNTNSKNYWTGFTRAEGGPVVAGLPYKVHRDETIIPTQDGMVFNKSQQAMMGNVYITVVANDAKSFMSRDTQAQITRQMVKFQQKRAYT